MRAIVAVSFFYSASALQQSWPHFPNIFGHNTGSVAEDQHLDSQDVAKQHHHHHHASSNSTVDIFAEKHDHADSRGTHHHHASSDNSYNRSLFAKCSEVNSHDGVKPLNQERCLDANLVLVRIFKTGTSSFAGVLRRIASRYGLNGVEEKEAVGMPEPLVSTDHFPFDQWEDQKFVQKIKTFAKPNMLMTIVRDPMERWLSDFYYRKSKSKKSSNDQGNEYGNLMDFLVEYAKGKKPNYMINYLRPGHFKEPDMKVTPQQTLDRYSLVGITERFDDSVVALMFMLGMDTYCDVLFTRSKTSTSGVAQQGFHWLPHIPLDEQPAEIKEYVQSEKFQASQHEDLELYAEAVRRLDAKIEAIGKERFLKRREEYVKWNEQAQSSCDKDGESSAVDCYFSDQGCHRKCLDKFCAAHAEELKVHDGTTPMWGSELFSEPLTQSR